MKSILLIARCPPYPLHEGDRLILWHLSRELARRGYTLDLLALYNRADDPGQIHHYRHCFRRIELVREPARRPLQYLRRLMLPSARFAKSAVASFCPPLWRHIADALDSTHYDLVHCFGAFSVYEYFPLFAHLPNVITPYESHTLYLQSAARGGDLRARLRLPLVRRYERFMFQPYDRAVVISEADRALLLRLQPRLAAEVIPNGIELERFHAQAIERDPATVLFVGNFAYPPNQDAARALIDTLLPQIRQALPQARLQLVGVNPPDWLRAAANAHIEVSGAVPDVAPYLARASIFLCPLRVGAGLKNKVLEALAMGIPVVATPLSVEGIAVRDGESASIAPFSQLAARAITLLKDEALCRRLSKKGWALIQSRYSWAQVAASYERLYAEICRRA